MAYPNTALLPRPLDALAQPLKRAIAQGVVAVFNDKSRGEAPVTRRMDGLFGPRAVAWRVHGDVTSMMVGGVSGLLLQMLHPATTPGRATRRTGPRSFRRLPTAGRRSISTVPRAN